MENFTYFFKKLNLLYYEYDKTTQRLSIDKNAKKEDTYQEFIKITYKLTERDIEFFVDNNKNIILLVTDTYLTRFKEKTKNFKSWLRNKQKKIYLLSDKKVDYAINIPMIRTVGLDVDINFNGYDCIVFTSKNAVKFVDKLTKEWKHIPAYAIGPQTAKSVKLYGGNLKFVGLEKHGNEFANELIQELEGKKVLYLGAEKIVSNTIDILNENNISCDYKAVYKTISNKKRFRFPKESIIIFSSPSIVEGFFKHNIWDESFTAISIGRTTAKYFPEAINPIISENTSLEGCVQTALNL
jgi:uroporphyrinogen-III synthase